MNFCDGGEAVWADWDKNNRDPYGAAVVEYARLWIEGIEERMAAGASLEECWKGAQPNGLGITGFQYGAAVSIVATVWEHGDALRRLHNLNAQIGDEGEKANESGGVLNPALLNLEITE